MRYSVNSNSRYDLGVDQATRRSTVEHLVAVASNLAKLGRISRTAEEREVIHSSYTEVCIQV